MPLYYLRHLRSRAASAHGSASKPFQTTCFCGVDGLGAAARAARGFGVGVASLIMAVFFVAVASLLFDLLWSCSNQRSTQTPPAAGLSSRSGTGFAGHRPVTAGWHRPPPGHRQPAPAKASQHPRSPVVPPESRIYDSFSEFYEKNNSEFYEKNHAKRRKMVFFSPHLTADTAGHQPASGWSLRPVTGHDQPPGG